MNCKFKRISTRTMYPAPPKSADVSTKKMQSSARKKSKVPSVHEQIQHEAARIRTLATSNPGYVAGIHDAPQILKLVRAAVKWVNSLPPSNNAKTFLYQGKRYPLLFTNLGRLIVCDTAGNKLGSSGFGAV